MKRTLALILALLLLPGLLAGCGETETTVPTTAPDPALSEEPRQEPTREPPEEPAPAGEIGLEQAREQLGPWLEKNCSFGTHFLCLEEPELCWMEERIDQDCGADDSFSFVISRRLWDRETERELEEGHWYYYAWENDKYVCTLKHDDSPVEISALSRRDQEDLHRSRDQFIGVERLLPACAEDFRLEEAEGEPELLCLRCTLPLEWILQEHPLLAQRLLYVLEQKGLEDFPEGLRVKLAFSVEKEGFRPRCLRYDFSELIPALFPEAAEAGEGPVLEMEYRFDFALAETVPMPEALREQSTGVPEPGVIEDGEFRQPFFGLRISVEGWELASRDEIGLNSFGIPQYASYSMEELLAAHIPYAELSMKRGGTFVHLMLEKPPITTSDGARVNTPAEYMDADARNLPRDYASIGLSVLSDERFQRELCGLSFEGYRIVDSEEAVYTVLATEKGGVFLTVMIDCRDGDETETVLNSFKPETYPILGQARLEDCTLTIHYDDGLILRNRPLSLEELMEDESAHHTAIPGTELIENEDLLTLLAKLDPEELQPVQDTANYAGRIYPTVYYVLTDPEGKKLFDLGMGWDNLDEENDERPASVNFNGEKIPFDELFYTCVARWLTQAHYVPGYCDVTEVQDG